MWSWLDVTHQKLQSGVMRFDGISLNIVHILIGCIMMVCVLLLLKDDGMCFTLIKKRFLESRFQNKRAT